MTGQELWASLLQEAIQGRLVEQRDDEPDVPQIGDAPEDMPFAIPEKWKWRKLKDLFNFIDYRGKTPQKTVDGIRLMTASNIKRGFIDHTRIEYISKHEYAERQSRGISKKGDILFTTEAPLGNVAIADLDVYSAGQRIITLQSSEVNKKLFMFFLLSKPFQNILQENATGTTAKGIKAARLKEIFVPLPPLAEQRRIVARLEELRPLVDDYGTAEAELSRLEADLPDRLRASLLQEAISGRLVEQRDDEPAVEQIGDAPEDVPFAIPEKWKWVRLKDCAEFNPKVAMALDSDVSFIPMAAVAAGYENSITPGQTKKWKEVKAGFSRFADGDVIFAKITPCFQNKKSAICANLMNGAGAGSTEFHVLRSNRKIDTRFLLLLVKSDYFIAYGVENFKGTAGQKRIGAKDAQNCPVPLPPLDEQRRIAARLEKLLPEVAALIV